MTKFLKKIWQKFVFKIEVQSVCSSLFVIFYIALLFPFNNTKAQNLNFPQVMQRIDSPIILDGKVDEAAWQKIKPLQLISHWPEFGNAPSDHTELRVTYDENYIYFSGVCNSSPENILAASFKRDLFTLGTDYISIILDTFNDNENALSFATTPTGNRSDQAISEDAAKRNSSWDTFWDAESFQDENGWSAEMRIPFSSLGFQVIDNKVTMGLIAWRYTAKKNEMNIFPTVRPDFGFWSFVKPSQMKKVIFENVKSSNPVYVTPYALGGSGQEFVLKEDSTGYRGKNNFTKSLGLDIKYNVTDNLTLDFSINTDFAQVEADDQQVNLTRFSLFFPEKRRFFLERASIFDFSFGGYNRLFYTRRIGLQDGEPVSIIGGGRLAGRIGEWDVGVLDVQTTSEAGLDAENFGVLRLKKKVFNQYSYIGGMFTNRIDENGDYNVGYGLDGVFRLFGHDYLSFNFAQTYENDTDLKFDFGNSLRARLIWERKTYINFAYKLAVESAGKDYNPAMGFEHRDNFSHIYNEFSYGWDFKGHPLFQRHQLSIESDIYSRNIDGSIETIEISPQWEGAFVFGGAFWMGLNLVQEDLIEGFDLADNVEVPAGEHTYSDFYIGFDTPGGNELSGWTDIGYGSFFDGQKFSASIGSKWIASRYFELNGSYDYHKLEFENRNQSLESHVVQIRSLLALNTKLSLASFIQYNSSANISLANIRFRYNPREGSDLYIVYNEQFNSDRRREFPVLPTSRNRTILAKYTYTFAF
jgi:uncharacterized protein DUF5916/cellulose/xylan binding protein with CBM9 domain